MRERYIENDTYTTYGQDAIVNGEIIANYYGNHDYSTEKFITDKTLADIKALDVTESHSTEVYVVKATVEVVETPFFTNLKITTTVLSLTSTAQARLSTTGSSSLQVRRLQWRSLRATGMTRQFMPAVFLPLSLRTEARSITPLTSPFN